MVGTTGEKVANDTRVVLTAALQRALDYRASLSSRSYRPEYDYRQMCAHFREPVPESGRSSVEVIRELADRADPGLMSMAGPRFFGWVLGGSDPVGVAADWLVSAWGQNSGNHTPTPSTAAIEQMTAGWLTELLELPFETSVGFTTGATVANMVALCAARGHVLRNHGWDADAAGLFGAPEVHVFVGEDAHTSVFSALRYAGLGEARAVRVRTDTHGRMDPLDLADTMQARHGPKIVIAQAGQINTGAFDPFSEIAEVARAQGAWLHVDGAFGLWARASAQYRHLTEGIEHADSWGADGHKWLQVPFDCGYVFVRDREIHRRAMTTGASYLPPADVEERVPSDFVPELSRRARAVPTWAMIKKLGRTGIAELVERHCRIAGQIAGALAEEPGVEVLNDVVLNQVIVRFGGGLHAHARSDELTAAVIDAVQARGECFVAGARWHEHWVMRISVICGATTDEDGALSCAAILDAWRQVRSRDASGSDRLSTEPGDGLKPQESEAALAREAGRHAEPSSAAVGPELSAAIGSAAVNFCTSSPARSEACGIMLANTQGGIPMNVHTVQGAGGVKLHVREWGKPAGIPILLIHGWSQSHLCWTKQHEGELQDEFRIVTVDLRGHGMSDAPLQVEQYTDGDKWADDVAAIIDHLGLDRPILVGSSYGGFVISDYVRKHGQTMIAGINFVGASALLGELAQPFIGPAFRENAPGACSADLPTSIAAMRSFLRALLAKPISQDDFELALAFNMVVHPQVRAFQMQRELDFTPILESLEVPVLVSHGRSDTVLLPAMADLIRAHCKTAEASWYDGVGHAPFLEEPERFNRELARFAKRARSGAAKALP